MSGSTAAVRSGQLRAAPTQLSPVRIRLALLALALGGFAIGATEFVAMGLLPNLASDLLPGLYGANPAAANAQASWLVSAYALGVVVGAPTIATAAARLPRKQLLLGLTAAFTIANVIGVPAITLLCQTTNWRVAYLAVAAIFALSFVSIAFLVPLQPGDSAATMRRELRAFGRAQVWLALLIGAVGFGGFFAVYTFVSPLVTDVAGLGVHFVPIVLIVVGLGMTVGNIIGGWSADRNIMRSIFVFFGVFAVSLVGLATTSHSPVGLFVFTFMVGASAAALSPAIQTRLMDVAGDSQTLAAAVNHASLNLGNSLGAFLGGAVVVAGLGYVSPSWVGLALCVPGVGLALASVMLERRRPIRRPQLSCAES